MSEREPDGLYVYQPFGTQHPQHWEEKRIYGVGGLSMLARIDGLTKAEAEAIIMALVVVPRSPASEASARTVMSEAQKSNSSISSLPSEGKDDQDPSSTRP